MSQSSNSMHSGNLEKRLGYRLRERGKGGFRLSPKGRQILEASQKLSEAIGERAGSLAGDLI